MKVAIHHRKGSFSEPWIKFCEENKINYKLVNCFENNIIEKLKDCNALLWHHHHGDYKDIQLAKPLLFSLEQIGIKVFPNFNTNWHFDNKLAQKYLLEAAGVPFVKTYVFFTKQDAIYWARNTSYPKVFKLKGGAGAANVRLAKSQTEAVKLINKSFNSGWPVFDKKNYIIEHLRKLIYKQQRLIDFLKAFKKLILPVKGQQYLAIEKGYSYFQDFIPNNNSDIRVIVVGNKAFAIKRMVRKGDFRASGSGHIVYQKDIIDERCIKLAFETNNKIGAQCLAYDFVFDENKKPLIIEISYGFSMEAYKKCPGYWDMNLNWVEGKFNPYGWMISDLQGSL
tara:strand:+ start:2902 stop:3915 length:1014 start_codon:yes stop_codon:yes gene_type:complete